jgi:hypothetical protein
MIIKALSLYQPWASAVPGPKGLETRGWDTSYRGPLLICAAQKVMPFDLLLELGAQEEWCYAMAPIFGYAQDAYKFAHRVRKLLPYGKAVATCNLVATYRTGSLTRKMIGANYPFGDFSPERYALDLRDRKAIKEPFPVRGRQKLFDVEVPGLMWRFRTDLFETNESREGEGDSEMTTAIVR